MLSISKSKQLAVTQAKVIRANGDVEYYISKPKVGLSNIKGRFWLWRRVRALKKERKGK